MTKEEIIEAESKIKNGLLIRKKSNRKAKLLKEDILKIMREVVSNALS